MAGNLPLVGFHDFLSVFVAGHKALIRFSSKDDKLFSFVLKNLVKISPESKEYFETTERLQGFDAVIATGSSNTGRYFEHYFGKYPNIIRKNRSSVAVLDGNETIEELKSLGEDVFTYFGMGCRNVSKLYVPKDYDFPHLLDNWAHYQPLTNHNKYKNNYDYNRSILLLNRTQHFASDYIMLMENENMTSPVSILYYEFYDNEKDWRNKLKENAEQIQCSVGKAEGLLPFGTAQNPQLNDYADGIDTMQFLSNL